MRVKELLNRLGDTDALVIEKFGDAGYIVSVVRPHPKRECPTAFLKDEGFSVIGWDEQDWGTELGESVQVAADAFQSKQEEE